MNHLELISGIVDFVNEIKFENRFHLKTENVVQQIYEYFSENNLEILKKGTIVYRARIDFDSKYELNGIPLNEMGAPPPIIANEGRVNPIGMGCLYCAEEVDTAIAELRPWAGAYVTVAKGVVLEDCEIIVFHKNIFNKNIEITDHKSLFELSVNGLFTGRHSPQSKTGYLPSQYIAEYLKNKNIKGIGYRSSLSKKGNNLALFNPSSVEFSSLDVFKIQDVKYKYFNLNNEFCSHNTLKF